MRKKIIAFDMLFEALQKNYKFFNYFRKENII